MKFNGVFIKYPKQINSEFSFNEPAIRFRRKFHIEDFSHAQIFVCGLGYGYYFINGEKVSNDMFTAPVSDYRKTVWYNKYDVTHLLKSGENVFCAYLGNGFLNESFDTPWGLSKAEWRDVPKLFCALVVDGKVFFESDEKFKCSLDNLIYFNQLRSGEYWNFNCLENWCDINYDDSKWKDAVVNEKPMGKLMECQCQPIRECQEFKPIGIYKVEDKYVFDFGQNISGYVRFKGVVEKGQEIKLFHAETVDENYGTMLNDEDVINHLNVYAKSVPFQTDIIIGNGNYIEWSPLFTYHGFRYVEVSGLIKDPQDILLTAVFVHQDVKRTSYFESSNEILNKIYQNGIFSTYSNMFYSLTDCPTREKLGWLNDSCASVGQVLINFDSQLFFKKWLVDIYDSISENGDIAGIAPSNDWGYDFGGVCSIAIAQIPYKLFLLSKDKSVVEQSLPYTEKCFGYFESRIKDGNSGYWLGDWTGSYSKETPIPFIEKLLAIKFINIIVYFRSILGLEVDYYNKKREEYKNFIECNYLENGYSKCNCYTAISMLIVEKVGDREILKKQLEELYEAKPILDCGMVGIQFVYEACSIVKRGDIALDLITNDKSFFKQWIDGGATTLYESYDENPHTLSLNHHMFSNVLEWLFTGVLGIKIDAKLGKDRIDIDVDETIKLGYAKGKIDFDSGSLFVQVKNGKLTEIVIDGDIAVYYKNKKINKNYIFKE